MQQNQILNTLIFRMDLRFTFWIRSTIPHFFVEKLHKNCGGEGQKPIIDLAADLIQFGK